MQVEATCSSAPACMGLPVLGEVGSSRSASTVHRFVALLIDRRHVFHLWLLFFFVCLSLWSGLRCVLGCLYLSCVVLSWCLYWTIVLLLLPAPNVLSFLHWIASNLFWNISSLNLFSPKLFVFLPADVLLMSPLLASFGLCMMHVSLFLGYNSV